MSRFSAPAQVLKLSRGGSDQQARVERVREWNDHVCVYFSAAKELAPELLAVELASTPRSCTRLPTPPVTKLAATVEPTPATHEKRVQIEGGRKLCNVLLRQYLCGTTTERNTRYSSKPSQ